MFLPISIEDLDKKITEGEQALKNDLLSEYLFIFWKKIVLALKNGKMKMSLVGMEMDFLWWLLPEIE